ncbi:MAG: 2OG-Fe(II) oxygenase [Verrucomicrobia bacterium]|nr:2OG-Fe(II) oxygenase [Verrucomicrobiota bacterium]
MSKLGFIFCLATCLVVADEAVLDYIPEVKIGEDSLGRDQGEIFSYFGPWVDHLDVLHEQFSKASPFPYVVIDDFLALEVYQQVVSEFPKPSEGKWHFYNNPLEIKYAKDNMDEIPPLLKEMIYVLNERPFIDVVCKISGISELVYDPYLHGGGLHSYPANGKLDMHLDYNVHPITKMERRLNLIYYTNEQWEDSWGGDIEFWSSDMAQCEARVLPKPNRAVLFQTSGISFHGLPDLLKCPEGVFRQSIAIYYVSPLRAMIPYRHKASYYPRPGDVDDPRMNKLREIRSYRRITPDDIEEIWPNWKDELTEAN